MRPRRNPLILALFLTGGWLLADAGETLYNGMVLPPAWPPSTPSDTTQPPPYLAAPPKVIPIDVGRQLFVDDFLIEHTSLKRTFHRPSPHPANPILQTEKPWEVYSRGPGAAPFSGGVCYDPNDRKFKLFYTGGTFGPSCLALSDDGVRWSRPAFDVEPGTNVIVRHRHHRDSDTIWMDLGDPDPRRRYKMFTSIEYELPGGKALERGGSKRTYHLEYRVSADGVHWSEILKNSPVIGRGVSDRTTVFYNPFRRVWVYSLRDFYSRRSRAYREHPDAMAGLEWESTEPVRWVAADKLDPRHPDPTVSTMTPELYNLDCFPYESLMVGMFSILEGPSNTKCAELGIQKRNEIFVGFSRDGFHWDRPWRERFIPVDDSKPGAWNAGNVQSVAGSCLVVGDKLYFYFTGRPHGCSEHWDACTKTGLTILRRDGFASMDAVDSPGTLTTRPVLFRGRHLFVNANLDLGELHAEVLDAEGRVIAPFTRENCSPVQADKTSARITWKGAADLSALAGKPVKFRFHVFNGSLYAFWVSPDATGASYGYMAAGGPGFTGPTDTVGTR